MVSNCSSMGTLETLTLLCGAGFSGRVPTLVSASKKGFFESSHTSPFENIAGKVVQFLPVSACQMWERFLNPAISRLDSNIFSRRCESEESRRSIDQRQSSRLLGPWDGRTRGILRVSKSPVFGTDSRPIFSPSEVPLAIGKPVEDELVERGPPTGLFPELMPRHVAIIMDGNSRWASDRGLPSSAGHAAGANALKNVAKIASEWGIGALTVFAFSTENWRRSQTEVDFLMHLFEAKLQAELANLMRANMRLRVVGDTLALPLSVQRAAESAKQCTSVNTGMVMNICLNYSGRADLVRACQELATQVAGGNLSPSDIDVAAISSKVCMSELGDLQDPDLVIRTSGEHRISNFLLWQAAYSEFVFPDTLWPDFGTEEFKSAILTYQSRDRRFGIRHNFGRS